MNAGIKPFQQPAPPTHNTGVVPAVQHPRSTFDKSHRHLTTMDPGYLYPVVMDQVDPGQTIDFKPSILARIATLLKPLMHRGYVQWEAFFYPDRLCQKTFINMMGEQVDPGDSIDYVRSKIDFAGTAAAQGSIYDYAGLPTQVLFGNNQIIAAPFLAYNAIWNNEYRDQNYQDSVYFNDGDGPHSYTDFTLKKRAKFHDRFTSVLPWQQKGDPVDFNLAGFAPVVSNNQPFLWRASDGTGNQSQVIQSSTFGAVETNGVPGAVTPDVDLIFGGQSGLETDLSSVTAFSVNDFIYAYQSQQLLMIDAQRGTRYPEFIFGHWGVVSDDARLQRPEYLGGGTLDLVVGPVPNTSSTTGNLGDLGAYGYAHGSGHGEDVHRSFTEYGWFIVLVSIQFDLLYQQGIDPKFIRDSKDSMYIPILASIPEQPLLNQEVVFTNSGTDLETFGFTPAWEDKRVGKSMVTGNFRSNATDSLDVWHLAQDFRDPVTHNPALPTMGDAFIQENPPIGRVIATPDDPSFVVDMWFDYKSTQVMPLYGWPGLSQHL